MTSVHYTFVSLTLGSILFLVFVLFSLVIFDFKRLCKKSPSCKFSLAFANKVTDICSKLDISDGSNSPQTL